MLKAFLNRLFFNLGVGFLYGATLAQADSFGAALLIAGLVIGWCLYR